MNRGIPAHYEMADGTLACGNQRTDVTVTVRAWASTTCNDCLNERHSSRRRWFIAAVIGVAAIAALGICSTAIILSNSGADDPMLSQSEIDQTIVADGVQATLRSVHETKNYPTKRE